MDLTDVDPTAREGNVARLFDETAAHHGDATAIEHRGERTTHAELRDASAAFAGGLHDLGLDPGDRLLLFLPNCPPYLVASLGALKAGVVASPVDPQYKRRELAYQLEDTDAAAVLTHTALRSVVAEACEETDREPIVITVGESVETAVGESAETADGHVEGDHAFAEVRGVPTIVDRADEDAALLPYTSGTTGEPKGVRLTHRNARAQLCWGLTATTDELDDEGVRSLVWLPLYHITGFTHTACQPLVRGGAVYLRSAANWDPETCLALVEEEGITHFVGVTAMYADMVGADAFGEYDLSSLVVADEGGAKLSGEIQRSFEATAGVAMSEGYGLTETHGATHVQRGSTFGLERGTIGQPLRMTDCKIVDEDGAELSPGEEGELLVRGPQVMSGYHGMPETTEAAFTDEGYFRTGDVARRSANNYYEIVDRKKHVIVSAGYNVYPSEVEEVLLEHDAVADAAVVGIPDDRRNEVPKAFVVPADGAEVGTDVTPDEIAEYALDRIAAYKHPREVAFLEELPRTTSGKVRKFELEERHTGGSE